MIRMYVKITWLPNCATGWGNGYVAVPKSHPLFGKEYIDSDEVSDIAIHGGITYSEGLALSFLTPLPDVHPDDLTEFEYAQKNPDDYWVFGFDTAHWQDSPITWPKERVIQETDKLAEILKSFDK